MMLSERQTRLPFGIYFYNSVQKYGS